MSAREAILERIRRIERSPVPVPARGYRRRGALGAPARTELFVERLADYRAEVRRAAADTVAEAISACCREHSVRRLGLPPGFPEEWRPRGIELVTDVGLTPRALDALDGVATGCTVAIAETGTIVLAGGPAEGRRALTLVPDLHICVVEHERIVELVPEAFAAVARLVRDERRPLTFVSGPSATSDIELNRVEGVHGPRTLIAIVTEEKP
jgi:L-lactate dehydrogenase complex protein LldG